MYWFIKYLEWNKNISNLVKNEKNAEFTAQPAGIMH